MINYEHILGHERPIAQLERARRNDRVAHAYLFHGPDGVGKQRVALAFAAALNCDADPAPCGECESCSKIERFGHPDVRLVASEDHLVKAGLLEWERGNPSVQIKNEQLDELADLFRHRPYLGRTKVIIVVDADRMNTHAQNRFLKTLEEPNPDSVILLVSAHPDALLPTIRSRCQALAFGPLPRDAVAGHLVEHLDQAPERARVLAAMAHGSLGRAIQLAEGGMIEARDEAVSSLAKSLDGDLADLLDAAEPIGAGRDAREKLSTRLDLLEQWLRDVLLTRLGLDQGLLINQDLAGPLCQQADRMDGPELLALMERLRAVRGRLRANANPRMAYEALLLDMRHA